MTPTNNNNIQMLQDGMRDLAESVRDLRKHLQDAYVPRSEHQIELKAFADLITLLTKRVEKLEEWRDKLVYGVIALLLFSIATPIVVAFLVHIFWK